MNTGGYRYYLRLPTGERVGPYTWDVRRTLMQTAPPGTQWLDANGVLLGTTGKGERDGDAARLALALVRGERAGAEESGDGER